MVLDTGLWAQKQDKETKDFHEETQFLKHRAESLERDVDRLNTQYIDLQQSTQQKSSSASQNESLAVHTIENLRKELKYSKAMLESRDAELQTIEHSLVNCQSDIALMEGQSVCRQSCT